MRSTAGASGSMAMRTGLRTMERAKVSILAFMVAEKKSVCRSVGSLARMRSMSGMNPMSSIRSTSSRMNISTCSS